MNIIDKMQAEMERLEELLNSEILEFDKAKYPDGKLRIKKTGKYYKLYHVKNTPAGAKRTYINKKQIDQARLLAKKAYKKAEIQALKKELQATKAYLRYFPKQSQDDYFRDSKVYRKLLESVLPMPEEYHDWSSAEYERNPDHPERLIYPTMKGDMVRSKSEAMIADELYRRGIPYRYECKTTIGGYDIYPDFTIIDSKTGKTYIWEHFGKMDDEEYVRKYLWKICLYVNNGYLPQISLLTTYETGKEPLTSVKVVDIIEQYF